VGVKLSREEGEPAVESEGRIDATTRNSRKSEIQTAEVI